MTATAFVDRLWRWWRWRWWRGTWFSSVWCATALEELLQSIVKNGVVNRKEQPTTTVLTGIAASVSRCVACILVHVAEDRDEAFQAVSDLGMISIDAAFTQQAHGLAVPLSRCCHLDFFWRLQFRAPASWQPVFRREDLWIRPPTCHSEGCLQQGAHHVPRWCIQGVRLGHELDGGNTERRLERRRIISDFAQAL